LSKYQQIINQRNALLKDIKKHSELKDTLAIWDDSLTVVGAQIMKERYDYLKKLREPARVFHQGISADKETLDISYQSTSGTDENDDLDMLREKLREAFQNAQREDFYTGYTSVGPHRDDLDFKINDISVRRFGSQGQQRSAVLSMKLSEAQLLYEKNEERPIILLDDVLSELDNSRQDFLLNKVEDYQVFVTCCEESNKEQLKNGKVFYIENGVVM
ncbi:MAG: DNA replication and repair protein RecF, partial [Ruminococcus sp.]|nr:DNA replication and repair protein RecF [Ruminococcus sp.]